MITTKENGTVYTNGLTNEVINWHKEVGCTIVDVKRPLTKNKDGEEVRNLFTVKELSEKIRHRLYHIKNNDKEAEVFKELLSDINSMVDVKNNVFLIGIDKSKKNIDNIYNLYSNL